MGIYELVRENKNGLIAQSLSSRRHSVMMVCQIGILAFLNMFCLPNSCSLFSGWHLLNA